MDGETRKEVEELLKVTRKKDGKKAYAIAQFEIQDNKEASGISLVFNQNFFQEHNLAIGLSYVAFKGDLQKTDTASIQLRLYCYLLRYHDQIPEKKLNDYVELNGYNLK